MARREGSITQRSKGSWQIRYYGPPDSSGKRKQVNETVLGAKKAAEGILRERLTSIENGGYVPRDKETVAGFLERWLETYAATNTTLRTQEGYQGNIHRYIDPAIGAVPIQTLTARHIQAMYAGMLRRGLSNQTALHTHRVLRKAMADGVKWGVLSRNVADAATPPRPERKPVVSWDEETVYQFLDAAQDSRFYGLYQLALFTGMRRSELCGLKWENVNLAAGRLSVVSTLQRIPGKGLIEGLPKTPRSRRSISLGPKAVDMLHTFRGQQMEYQLAAGPLWQYLGFVFTQSDGTPADPESVSKDFCIIVRKARLPHLTLHGLRHVHATQLMAGGLNPKVVSERLGHSNIAVTMDTYSHVLPGLQEEAALVIEERLFRRRRPAMK